MAKRKVKPQSHPDFEPTRQFMAMIPELYHGAVAHTGDYSYRGVRVKSGIWALNEDNSVSEAVYGGNVKSKRSKEKICSEDVGLSKLEDSEFTKIGGLVVVSNVAKPEKIEEILHFPFQTLLPCVDCTTRTIPDSPLTNPDTLVVTARINEPLWQVHTLQEIEEIHVKGPGIMDSPLRYGFANWSRRVDYFTELVTDEVQKRSSVQANLAGLAIMALNADVLR